MRRLIVILLLALLPVQFGWAAAAVYCQHESGAAAHHFGHHEHVHKAAEHKQEGKSLAQGDVDCGICHLTATSNLPSIPQVAAISPPAAEYSYSLAYLSHVPSGPERPDRRLAS